MTKKTAWLLTALLVPGPSKSQCISVDIFARTLTSRNFYHNPQITPEKLAENNAILTKRLKSKSTSKAKVLDYLHYILDEHNKPICSLKPLLDQGESTIIPGLIEVVQDSFFLNWPKPKSKWWAEQYSAEKKELAAREYETWRKLHMKKWTRSREAILILGSLCDPHAARFLVSVIQDRTLGFTLRDTSIRSLISTPREAGLDEEMENSLLDMFENKNLKGQDKEFISSAIPSLAYFCVVHGSQRSVKFLESKLKDSSIDERVRKFRLMENIDKLKTRLAKNM